jgi:hypothetical protein
MATEVVSTAAAAMAIAFLLCCCVASIPRAALGLGILGQAEFESFESSLGTVAMSRFTATHFFAVAILVTLVLAVTAMEAGISRFNRKLAVCVGTTVEAVTESNPQGFEQTVELAGRGDELAKRHAMRTP